MCIDWPNKTKFIRLLLSDFTGDWFKYEIESLAGWTSLDNLMFSHLKCSSSRLWVPVIELSRNSTAVCLELWLTIVGAHWPARDAIRSNGVMTSSSVHAPSLAWLFQQFSQGPKKRRVSPSVSRQGTWKIRVSFAITNGWMSIIPPYYIPLLNRNHSNRNSKMKNKIECHLTQSTGLFFILDFNIWCMNLPSFCAFPFIHSVVIPYFNSFFFFYSHTTSVILPLCFQRMFQSLPVLESHPSLYSLTPVCTFRIQPNPSLGASVTVTFTDRPLSHLWTLSAAITSH